MGRIQVLPDRLIDRIAAGEVVERPASVAKELIENALDADARSIHLSVRGGGRTLIRVRDDGCGMDRDDALMALERHATSKVRVAEDLQAIRSFGFRGEALSSIAAISQFDLSTAVADGVGTEIRVRGGRIESVREQGLPRGTSVGVARLFFNVPARRKFLRTEGTELAHLVRLATRTALAHPKLRFELEHGGRTLLRTDPASNLSERVGQIHGRDFAERLLPFDVDTPGLRIRGLSGRPADAGPRRDAQHFFVNGRSVLDRLIGHAVSAAYANTVPRGRFPALFLFVEIDPEQVDVNVHPQKLEVRFRDSSAVHDAVRDAVHSALSHERAVPRLEDLRPAPSSDYAEGVTRAVTRYLDVAERATVPASGPPFPDDPLRDRAASPVTRSERSETGDLIEAMDAGEADGVTRTATPLAQYRDSYIVAQDGEGLLLVDQHAAHERVIFERYLDDAGENRVEVQRLLFPKTVDLAPDERLLLEEEADEFRRLGFEIEPFGGNTVRVDAVPSVTGELDADSLLRELLGEARQARSAAADTDGLRRRLVTSAACQAAIKVNYPLSRETMQGLLDDLFATGNPTTCPHGRPALFRLTLDELERAFRRR